MSNSTGRTFWDWVSENRNVALLLALSFIAVLGYAIYNKYIIETSYFSAKPTVAVLPTNDSVVEGKRDKTPEKLRTPHSNAESNNLQKEKTLLPKNRQELYSSYFQGKILNSAGMPISSAIVKCINCENSETISTDKSGEFNLKYTILKSSQVAEIKISANNQSITIHPSVTQTSIDDTIFEK